MTDRETTLRVVQLEPGWLKREIEAARRHVEAMPPNLRDLYRAGARALLDQPTTDPCRSPNACRTAQTCVGGCVYE